MKRVVILGSTGTLGRLGLEVLSKLKDYQIFGLSVGRNLNSLVEQISRFKPKVVTITDTSLYSEAKERLNNRRVKVLWGIDGLTALCTNSQVDIVLQVMSGTQGLMPTLEAIKNKKRLAIANKEIMVGFGEYIMSEAKRTGAEVLPVDSEEVAIHQCLETAKQKANVKRIILTASGGPFFTNRLKKRTIKQVLNHPVWKMGKKITVDSATLLNKGFEVIETMNFFGIPQEKISVLIHPQAIIHSLLELIDNSMLAQLSLPDMKLPIQYAITFPNRFASLVKPLDLTEVKRLEFYPPDYRCFPGLKLAEQAARDGGTSPVVLASANEVAVKSFLERKLSFNSIPKIIEQTLAALNYKSHPSLEELLEYEKAAKEYALIKVQSSK